MKWILMVMIWHGSALEQMEHKKYSSRVECVEAGFKLPKEAKWFCKREDGLDFSGIGDRR